MLTIDGEFKRQKRKDKRTKGINQKVRLDEHQEYTSLRENKEKLTSINEKGVPMQRVNLEVSNPANTTLFDQPIELELNWRGYPIKLKGVTEQVLLALDRLT